MKKSFIILFGLTLFLFGSIPVSAASQSSSVIHQHSATGGTCYSPVYHTHVGNTTSGGACYKQSGTRTGQLYYVGKNSYNHQYAEPVPDDDKNCWVQTFVYQCNLCGARVQNEDHCNCGRNRVGSYGDGQTHCTKPAYVLNCTKTSSTIDSYKQTCGKTPGQNLGNLTINGIPTSWTNSVTLTAAITNNGFSLNANKLLYNGAQTNNTTFPITQNGTYTFQLNLANAQDQHSAIELTINYLDTLSPIGTITSNIEPEIYTKENVILTFEGDDATATTTSGKSGIASYQWYKDGQQLTANTDVCTAMENGIYSVVVTDHAGNSNTFTYTVSNLDRTGPTYSVIGNPNIWTNQDIILSIDSASDSQVGLHTIPYSFDNGTTWTNQCTYDVSENTVIQIKVRDALENITTKEIDITKIDKVVPIISSVEADSNEWIQSGDTTITITASDDASGIHQYKMNQGSYQNSNHFVISENGTYDFYVKDIAGNESSVKSITIARYDTTAPTFVVNGNSNTWTKDNVTLSIDSIIEEESGLSITPYSFDNGNTWHTNTSQIFTENQTITIKVKDVVGNIGTSIIVIDKIDKTNPTLSLELSNDNWTNQDIEIIATATDSQSGLHENAYSYDEGNSWNDSSSNTISTNGTYKVKVRDTVENETEKEITVNHMDKLKPIGSLSK